MKECRLDDEIRDKHSPLRDQKDRNNRYLKSILEQKIHRFSIQLEHNPDEIQFHKSIKKNQSRFLNLPIEEGVRV